MKYISLGYFCSVALELEKLGLREESSPFDWVISDFEGVIRAIHGHFSDFLTYDYLSQDMHKHDIYKNTKYDMEFSHDFDKYVSLEKQLPKIQEKYNRRIQRFYESIKEPTLFIRYISDETKIGTKSEELIWIENNYENILAVLKSFNEENDILFIANEGVSSEKFLVYNVQRDEKDVVARSPIHKNAILYNRFSSIDHPGKQRNINRYNQKQKDKNRMCTRIKRKSIAIIKHLLLREYIHESQY